METISQYNGVYRSYADFINCNYPPAKATWCYPFAGVHRKNTMVIFAFHMPVFFYCQTLLRPLFKSQLCYKPIEFILIWGICLMLIPLFNRYAPILIGKK